MAKQTQFLPGGGYSEQDWEAVSDSPEWTEKDFDGARPFADFFPFDARRLGRGRRDRQLYPDSAMTGRRLANLAVYGEDFTALTPEFFERAVFRTSAAGRLLAIGGLRLGALAVVFEHRGGTRLEIVSARPASEKEQQLLGR